MEAICDILAADAARQLEQENAGAFTALDEIKNDMHKIEEDSKKFNFYAILDLIARCIKCFIDSVKCCFKIKYYNII